MGTDSLSGGDEDSGRTPPDTTPTITELSPVIELLEKPAVAAVYLAALDEPTTVPELLTRVESTKSTVYDYADNLQDAGLFTAVDERDGATVYHANEFTITFEIEAESVTISPELVRVLAHRDDNPEIRNFVDQYGVATLAEFVELAHEQVDGNVTTRSIATILDISRGSAYDVLERIQQILEIGGEVETRHADETSDAERRELLDRSS